MGTADHDHHDHGHRHGGVDAAIFSSERGLWALKWSLAGLGLTAALQAVIVVISGSVALLADTIHNFGDALSALPLAVAFVLSRRPPSPRFPSACIAPRTSPGLVIVGLILFSAVFAAYESIQRLIPRGRAHLAGRGRRRSRRGPRGADRRSHRRLLISLVIFKIVWDAAGDIGERMLDGIHPAITAHMHTVATAVPGVVGTLTLCPARVSSITKGSGATATQNCGSRRAER